LYDTFFAKAAPYWERIPRVSPGEAGGYLEAAAMFSRSCGGRTRTPADVGLLRARHSGWPLILRLLQAHVEALTFQKA